MGSKEEHNVHAHRQNTVTDNSDGGTTMALQRKRSRRVSFAETTSVHLFDRYEEYSETPPLKAVEHSATDLGFGGLPQPRKESEGADDNDDDDDADEYETEMKRPFLRPIGSPSPGASSIGSASSNDEDNFFGPVSARFINPGRLSDSAASDDNHDVTMDSTAFSMHYHSLARSESGVDIKTPTRGDLIFEEKTPTIANLESSMIFTLGKRPYPKSSTPSTEVRGNHESSDMSLVEENLNKYDYEKLSPELNALLEESRKNLLSVSVSDDIIAVEPSKRYENDVLPSSDWKDGILNLRDLVRTEQDGVHPRSMLIEEISAPCSELDESNGPRRTYSIELSPEKIPSISLGTAASDTADQMQKVSPNWTRKNGSETQMVAVASSPQQQDILVNTASPSKQVIEVTPAQEQRYKGSEPPHERETSIRRSITKLELLEKSFSSFSAKVDKSTIKSLEYLKSPNHDGFLENDHIVSKINFVEGSEDKFASARQGKGQIHDSCNDGDREDNLNQNHGESYLKQSFDNLRSINFPNDFIVRGHSADQSIYRALAASPSKASSAGNSAKRTSFTSKFSSEDALMAETDSLLTEIAGGKDGKTNVTPNKFHSTSDRILKKKYVSPGFQSSRYGELSDFDRGQTSTTRRGSIDVYLSTSTANADVCVGIMGDLGTPSVEVLHLNKESIIETDDRHVDVYNDEESIRTIDMQITPDKEQTFQVMHSKYLDIGSQSKNGSRFEESRPRVEVEVVSPSDHRNSDKPRLQKNLVDLPTTSPSTKELDQKQYSSIPAPKFVQQNGKVEDFSANKQKVELLLKLQKGGNYDPETLLQNESSREAIVTGTERKLWTDIHLKFTEDTKQLFSGSTGELNNKMVYVLEDMLIHWQRSHKYEMICTGVLPQNTSICHDLQHQRLAETISLLHQIVYGKAKLQLKHAKRESLLKKLQLLNTGIQQQQKLGKYIMSHQLKTCATKVLVDATGDQSSNMRNGHEDYYENLTTLKLALEALDRKILDLRRTFNACCKMKDESSCDDTITFVCEHLTKRASCRLVRQEMQMWVIHSLGSVNGQHDVVINYLGFIAQSIKVIVGPPLSAEISFKLDETNITKSFPNMEACTAFSFVFDAETTRKFVGVKTLMQEAQATNSLLGTLLDVIEEVQLALMEFRNLTQSRFRLSSAQQLDLMLCFFNFNTGRKVVLTLDLSCLKCGVYPSEILPIELGLPVRQANSSCGPIIGEISDALTGVRSGYMRILQLCRCISQVVSDSDA